MPGAELPDLNRRIEDGLTTPATARQLTWALALITTDGLTRFQVGLLADGAVRALTGWRDQLGTPQPGRMLRTALSVLAAYPHWTPCDTGDRCDRCASGSSGRCRFVTTPTNLVWATLFSRDEQVPIAVARAYLYGTGKAPPTATSYAKFHRLHPTAALRGAAVAARTLRCLDQPELAVTAAQALWSRKVRRTPGLTELYAARAEDNIHAKTLPAALRQAEHICSTGLQAGTGGEEWDRVRATQSKLTRRLQTATAPPFEKPHNTRQAHPTRFARP